MRLIDADAFKKILSDYEMKHDKRRSFDDYDCGAANAYEHANDLLDEMPTEKRPLGEWIPCSERLPEECENALAWIERDAWIDWSEYPKRKQEIAIGWHIDGRWHFDGYAGSTTECLAWMPLPEPYKEEGDEK